MMVLHLEPWLAAGVVLPGATVWRAHRQSDGAGGAAPQLAGVLAHWLSTRPDPVRLRLVLEVGGHRAETLWVGVSVPGATDGSAARHVEATWHDVAEALDTYGLIGRIDKAVPQLGAPTWVEAVSGSDRPAARSRPSGSSTLRFLKRFRQHPQALSLVVDLQTPGHDPGPIEAVEQGRDHFRSLEGRRDELADLSTIMRLNQLEAQLFTLSEVATATEVRVSLHGGLPGAVLMPRLLARLGGDLGARLRLTNAPPAPMLRGKASMLNLLGLLSATAGAGEHVDEDGEEFGARGGAEIPF